MRERKRLSTVEWLIFADADEAGSSRTPVAVLFVLTVLIGADRC